MDQQKKQKQFVKFLEYVLGRRPDEFGLAPDEEGYVKIKELVKAINEEPTLKYIKKSNVSEILITLSDSPFETDGTKIRAINRDMLVTPDIPDEMPKIIYTCVRKKAYPLIIENGVQPSNNSQIVLSPDLDMAQRIGKRKGKEIVLLSINVQQAERSGVLFSKLGEKLYLARFLPVGCFSGPPLSKQKIEQKKRPAAETEKNKTFNDIMSEDLSVLLEGRDKKNSRRDKTSWKDNKKRLRKNRQKEWPE